MDTSLKISPRRRDRFPRARRARPPPRSRHRPVPQGLVVLASTSPAASTTAPRTSPTASACGPAIATAMVDYPIGELIAGQVRAMGVTPFYKTFEHDGVRGPNMATVYSDRGFGVRGPVVFYNRSNEAAALLKPGDFDWKAIFGGGVRWFHSGGIFAALSETTAGTDHRGDEGGEGARGGRVVRPELPREAVDAPPAAPIARSPCSAASSSTSTCWSATRRTCRRASASPARRSPRSRSSIRARSST